MTYPKITLQAARVNVGLNQEESAKELDISKATLQNYESGVTTPTWDMVKKMEKFYGIPADFLFFGDELRLKRNKAQQTTS